MPIKGRKPISDHDQLVIDIGIMLLIYKQSNSFNNFQAQLANLAVGVTERFSRRDLTALYLAFGGARL